MSIRRFDFVKHDDVADIKQNKIRELCILLENTIERELPMLTREKSIAMTLLEECYMWLGKCIRHDQINRKNLVHQHRVEE